MASVYKSGKRARVVRDSDKFVVEKKLDATWVTIARYEGTSASTDALTHFQNLESVIK